jgi:hypothetical protein
MSWEDILCVCLMILGIIVFVYGSNVYNATFGWGGLFIMIAGVIGEIVLEVYRFWIKRGS